MALFVQLDTAWPDNVKVIRVGLEGAGLHAMAMCVAKRTETDGVLHRAQLYRLGATDDLIDLLLDEGLFDPVDYGSRPGEDPNEAVTMRVHDWHDRNPSQAAIAANRSAKVDAAMRGNHKRWKHRGKFEDCEVCHTDKPQRGRSSDTDAIAPAKRVRSPESESESESESTTSSNKFDAWWGAYPRKVGKKAAAKAYAKALKETTDEELMSALRSAIRGEWRDRAIDKIPHPTTWLNQGRWEDEIADAAQSATVEVDGVTLDRSAR